MENALNYKAKNPDLKNKMSPERRNQPPTTKTNKNYITNDFPSLKTLSRISNSVTSSFKTSPFSSNFTQKKQPITSGSKQYNTKTIINSNLKEETYNKKQNLYTMPKLTNNTYYSVSLKMAKATMVSNMIEQKSKTVTHGNRIPPQHAKIKRKEESYEEFFSKHAKYFNISNSSTHFLETNQPQYNPD